MRASFIAVCILLTSSNLQGRPFPVQLRPASTDSQLSSRIALSGGMGVEYLSVPNVVDFVNASIGAYTRQRVPEFKSAVQFFGAISYPLATDWVLKAEYVYLLGSYNPDIPTVPTEFTLTVNMPTVIIQYVAWDEGLYNLKMGAGLGYHFATLTTKYVTVDDQLSGSGVGGLVEVEANTPFGEHLFAYLGADLRWELIGTMTNSRNSQVARLVLPNMHAFGIGARLGLSYYF